MTAPAVRRAALGVAVLTALAAVLFGLGWVVGWMIRAVWPGLSWVGAALRVGYRDARRPR